MATPQALLGDQFAAGVSTDNSTTDQFLVAGLSNTIQEESGNLDVTGFGGVLGSGPDTGTQIDIGGADVTDNITLDGGSNVLDDSAASTPGDHSFGLSNAAVSYTVSGNAGGNTVNLDDAGGTVTVKTGGDANQVILSDSAANTVTFTKASADNIAFLGGTGTNTVTAANSAGGNELRIFALRSRRKNPVGRTRGYGAWMGRLWRFHRGRSVSRPITVTRQVSPAPSGGITAVWRGVIERVASML